MSTAQSPDPTEPYAIAHRYAAGELSWDEALPLLAQWHYEPSFQPANDADELGIEPDGSFSSTVGRALDDGLITAAQYDQVLDARDALRAAGQP
ncbi:hypothetical protein CLV92_107243 [Kineococcus xinjiangensis]|uniref:Uncharacterized protein n=1 Tax=Kineococcus xinjiangensis TaxID=512762 RepID=A0A2S6IKR4_9ACTN|nr:hypothetical protein [Kineococcus xinjiangensis]PPK94740.1 hypothetical protein CLV92_107243 [Kineococcus xinjiangensis]